MSRVFSRGIPYTLPALAALAFAVPAAAQQYAPPPSPAENVSFAYADVLRVDPIYETVRYSEPREECYDQPVVYREQGGGDLTGGTVLGAIVGGVLGSQVGSGSGRNAATVAGAVAGGAIGRGIDKRNGPPGRQYERMETRCRTVDVEREERRVAGYDVEYQYKGDVYLSRLPYDPGSKLRVRVAVAPAD